MLTADPIALVLAALGVLVGGMMKGATGAGAPVVAVPVLAAVFDVPTAVTLFVVPNLLSNIWQSVSYRSEALPARFVYGFAAAGLVGAGLGTFVLAWAAPRALEGGAALVVAAYIAFRLARPGWRLRHDRAASLAVPAGLAGGFLQGAIGVSAPIAVTFLNAMGLARATFIGTVSVYFVAMALAQLPLQLGLGLMTWDRFGLGLVAFGLVLAGMPIGAAIARRLTAQVFDKVMLGLLAIVAIRLAASAAGV